MMADRGRVRNAAAGWDEIVALCAVRADAAIGAYEQSDNYDGYDAEEQNAIISTAVNEVLAEQSTTWRELNRTRHPPWDFYSFNVDHLRECVCDRIPVVAEMRRASQRQQDAS